MPEASTASDYLTKPFRPVAFYDPQVNCLYVYERDCMTVTHPGSRSGMIDILRDGGDGSDVVGVDIAGFKQIASWDIVDAVIHHYPGWFRFLYALIRNHRKRKLDREMKAAGFPFA